MDTFKSKIYKVVSGIPSGKTLTYKQVAKLAGRPKAWRAVGNILNKNRDPKVSCHRVIRSDGFSGGYAHGAKKKRLILLSEGVKLK